MHGYESLGTTRSRGNRYWRPRSRILLRIVDELRQNHSKHPAIRAHRQLRILHCNLNGIPLRFAWMFGQCLGDQIKHLNFVRVQADLFRLQPPSLQKPCAQLIQPDRFSVDQCHKAALRLGQPSKFKQA